MSKFISLMTLGNLKIHVERKQIKNINLRVCPPYGEICITAPLRVSSKILQTFIISKMAWIEKRVQFYKNDYKPPKIDEFISGEKHLIWGQNYILDVTSDFGFIEAQVLNATHLNLNVPLNANKNERETIFNDWCLKQLKGQILIYMRKWQAILGLNEILWSVRKTKTRWGSYSLKTKRISLSFHLIKKSKHCLDYVILHELAHVFEPNHGPKFKKILDLHMPEWKKIQNELNRRTTETDTDIVL